MKTLLTLIFVISLFLSVFSLILGLSLIFSLFFIRFARCIGEDKAQITYRSWIKILVAFTVAMVLFWPAIYFAAPPPRGMRYGDLVFYATFGFGVISQITALIWARSGLKQGASVGENHKRILIVWILLFIMFLIGWMSSYVWVLGAWIG